MIPKTVVDQILGTARIEEVIGDYIALKKSGSNYKGLSPFANERSPSFMVSPVKQIFKDFSSGKGGNVVSFVMEMEQTTYPEALKLLARKYNIEVPEQETMSSEEVFAANEKESLYIVLEYAAKYFSELLENDPDGKAIGKTYFYERGFREETIRKFGLGYARKEWDHFTTTALKNGYKLEYIEKVGLAKTNDQGKTFDMFRDRVIFPIHNLTGRVVAFAGRQLVKDDRGPKYLNSPETPVYHKSDLLYGIYFAKNGIRLKDKCFLVEGYTDVITLHQAGIENVVASSGTALTEGQIRQIGRFTPNITVLYDGDPAGIKASQRGIDLILEQGLNVRLVIFPEGEDPDSYCKALGGEAFSKYIEENEQDFILFKSRLLLDEFGHDPLRKADAVKSIVNSIALIPDPIKRTLFATECARILEVAEHIIQAEITKARQKTFDQGLRKTTADPAIEKMAEEAIPLEEEEDTQLGTGTGEQEKNIARNLIRYGALDFEEGITVTDFILAQLPAGFDFEHPFYAEILQITRDTIAQEMPADELLYINHPSPEINAFAADVFVEKYRISPDWETRYEIFVDDEKDNFRNEVLSSLLYFKLRKIETAIERNQEAMKEITEEAEVTQLLERQVLLLNERRKITSLMGTTIVK